MVSALLILASLAMFSFPKRLSTSRPAPKPVHREKKNPSLREQRFTNCNSLTQIYFAMYNCKINV
ncbi:hypothetical protein L9F63_026034, partial [Diploptera punctata]